MDGRPPTSLSRSLLRLRGIGYGTAATTLTVAFWFDRLTEVGILAIATIVAVIWNTVGPPKTNAAWALATDIFGTGLVWWIFGPVPPVYLLLAYLVVVAVIVLRRPQAFRVIGATAALTLAIGLADLVTVDLPFHHTGDGWIGGPTQYGLPLAIVLYAAAIMLSISKTLTASRADLAASEQRLRLSFDGAAMGMITFEFDGYLTRVNRAFCEQIGYPEDTLLTMTWRDLIHADDQKAAEGRLREALRGGRSNWRVEDRLVRADGSVFWAGIVISLIRDEDGNPHSFLAQILDISEQKAAEKALATSEERYRSLFEGIPVALYRTSPGGRILDANPALVELLGYPDRETMLEMDVYDAYVEGDRRDEISEQLKAEGKAMGIEEQLRRLDGETIWVRDSARVVLDEDGEIAYFEGALVDTTARRKAETALRESEGRLQAIFDHAPIGVVAADLDGRIVAPNTEFARMLGRSVDELKTLSVSDVTHPEDRYLDAEMKQDLLIGATNSYRYPKRYFHADGHEIWVEASVTAIRDQTGEPQLLIGLIRDITDRRQAESERDHLIRILEATPDLVIILDVHGRVTYANRAGQDWYGLDMVGKLDISDLMDMGPGPTANDIFQTLLTSDVWQGDITVRSSTGEPTPGSAVVLAHRDEQGRITHISATFRDLAERIETQRRLERLVQSKDEFVASVSHELRTPLTAVVGLTQELRKSWETFTTAEIAEFIGLIADQATDVANLVEDLLVAARADIGKVSIAPRALELSEQVEAVLAALDQPSRDRVTVNVEPTPTWADPTRLRQIIRNLVTNAIRYGGGHIELASSTSNGHIELSISDDGPGISAGLEEKIFEPYARDHEPGSQPNSVGLGLTVSRHLARLMGGDLVYARGDRSTFTLTLPTVDMGPDRETGVA
jgi:PAS domain S-box-containing protein